MRPAKNNREILCPTRPCLANESDQKVIDRPNPRQHNAAIRISDFEIEFAITYLDDIPRSQLGALDGFVVEQRYAFLGQNDQNPFVVVQVQRAMQSRNFLALQLDMATCATTDDNLRFAEDDGLTGRSASQLGD